jgi:hypothetical protein
MSRNLTLDDLNTVYTHLLEQRLDALRLLLSAPVYERALQKMLDRLRERAPARGPAARPMKDELAAADRLHDTLGAAIWHLGQACALHPGLSDALRTDARSIADAFIPQRADLSRSYLDEAHAARQRTPLLDVHKDALQRITTPDGGTLEAWVRSFNEAGLQLYDLLQQRAALEGSAETAAENTPLRSEAVGLLGRLRAAVRDELEQRPELPRDLEHRLFAYAELIGALRENPRPRSPATPTDPNPA